MAFIVTKVISYRQNFKDRNRCILMKNKASADNGNAKEKIVIGADHKDDMDQRVDKDKDHFLICMAFIVTGFLICMAFIVTGFLDLHGFHRNWLPDLHDFHRDWLPWLCLCRSSLRSSLAWQCWHHHFRGASHDQSSLGTFCSVCSIVSSETYLL